MPPTKTKSKADVKSIVKDIDSNPEITIFFKKLWNNNNFQKFFFAQKHQIFPTIVDDLIKLDLPFLFWSNLPKKVKKGSITVFVTTSELEQQKTENLTKVVNESFEEMTNEIRDFVVYYLIKFVKSNEEIRQLIENKNFSYKLMKSILKDYSRVNIEVFEDFKDIEALITDKTDKDKEKITKNLLAALEKGKKEFESRWFDLFNAIDFSGLKGQYYIWGYGNLLEFLEAQSIKKDGYEDILSGLYELKLIKNISTAFWYKTCLDEPFIGHSGSNIAPTQFGMKCPKCGKGMAYSTAYDVHPLLKKMIYYPDGLLSCAFAWLLNLHKVEYISSSYRRGYEHDFIITPKRKRYLVECKMHDTSKDKQSIKEHLINDLTQLIKHIKALEKEKKKVNRGYVLTNHILENNQDVLNKAYNHSDVIKEYTKKYSIEVVDYTKMGELLKEFGVKLE